MDNHIKKLLNVCHLCCGKIKLDNYIYTVYYSRARKVSEYEDEIRKILYTHQRYQHSRSIVIVPYVMVLLVKIYVPLNVKTKGEVTENVKFNSKVKILHWICI